jgi:hypothetical protein
VQKASFFLTRRPEPLPAYPKYSHLPAIILLLIECSLGKPRLICTPESGGHPPSTRSDPVAPCLGDASVNVQGWSVAGQFSTVTTAFLNFLKQKRYFHEQRNNQSVDNP